ncbi:hypothetical protein NX059_011452 [Plenodomus lindquistii]|nr:hypothetical protein NX059_011452 [Plenodomus lindquistii]
MANPPTYIRNVALIGGTGTIGSHMLTHLLATNKHTVTVLTRSSSPSVHPSHPNLTITPVDYTNEQSLIAALTGSTFLIITLPHHAPPTLHPLIVRAAAAAKIPYIMPNYYGFGLGPRSGGLDKVPILSGMKKWIADVEQQDGVSYFALVCGFWYEFSLGMGEQWFGFDIAARRVVFFDQGRRRICTSTWERCGRAVAGLLSLPVRRGEGAAGPALEDSTDKGVYVASFLVSQREMLDSLHRVLGTGDGDWEIEYQGSGERYEEGLAEMEKGDLRGFAKAMYARLFFESGEGDYKTGEEMHDEVLGLPREELDEATRRAVEMVEGGFGAKNFVK